MKFSPKKLTLDKNLLPLGTPGRLTGDSGGLPAATPRASRSAVLSTLPPSEEAVAGGRRRWGSPISFLPLFSLALVVIFASIAGINLAAASRRDLSAYLRL